MIYVLDASAMIAFLRQETGGEVVRLILADETNACYIHALNLCEVFYEFHRGAGEADAQRALQNVFSAGVLPRGDMDVEIWQEAGRFKSLFRRVSLADCFCLALSRRLGAELLTSDHHEMDALIPLNLCPIQFIR
jgi:PIN domain nuclease of toxin-antitoxin system